MRQKSRTVGWGGRKGGSKDGREGGKLGDGAKVWRGGRHDRQAGPGTEGRAGAVSTWWDGERRSGMEGLGELREGGGAVEGE